MGDEDDGTWHTVVQGEWLPKIALTYGLPWKVIWKHPKNASLEKRRDPNILHPFDVIFIPTIRPREESRSTGRSHRFVRKTDPVTFELTLLDPSGEPLKNENYTLGITEPPLAGTTDGDGHLKHEELNPAKVHAGLLELPAADLQIWIDLGVLNPSHAKETHPSESGNYDDGLSGIQMRLLNLGYDPGATDGVLGEDGALPEETAYAIMLFQRYEMKLPEEKITGELDDDTRQAIEAAFGGK